LPLTEVVIDVDDGNRRLLATIFQVSDLPGHRQSVFEKLLAAVEFKIVDDID
jgi:hypothetical protein